jgi:glucosylglycerate synthase
MAYDAVTMAPVVTRRAATPVTVVGIPTRNEGPTVAHVARMADAGLRAAYPDGANAIVLADNGSTDDTISRFRSCGVLVPRFVVQSGGAGTGKGTNVFALMRRARQLSAGRLVLLDGDVRSAEPAWVGALADAVDGAEPAMAVPVYRRNRYEANSTNHLASPLLAALYGSHVQQPIGGEFAFNRAFLERAGRWYRPASAELYGIDIWLTANALREGIRVVEVPLGRKVHNSPFPKILTLPQQVLDTLLHVVARGGSLRSTPAGSAAYRSAVDSAAVRPAPAIVARITRTVGAYLDRYRSQIWDLFPAARRLTEAPWGLRVDVDAWPEILADAVERVAAGNLVPARDHLIALFVNRVFTFWDEIDGADSLAVDQLLDKQAAATAEAISARRIRFTGPPPTDRFDAGTWAGFA